MAYKDEYEVARLYTSGTFERSLAQVFEGDYKLSYHLAPPILGRKDSVTGAPRKSAFGPWMMTAFRMLAALKGLRGTAFDPFGRTDERRAERQAITDFERTIDEIASRLTPANHAAAVELAELPQSVKGFGHVKAANAGKARIREKALRAAFDRPAPVAGARIAAE
jgi:indolepyruvate ferredoxin oxidoreductase